MDLKKAQRRWVEQALRYPGSLRRFLQRDRQSSMSKDRNTIIAASEDGQSMLEMAFTLPALLALIFCFMELCLIFYTYHMISESAREGTRYAMVHGATCPTSANPTCKATAAQVNTYVLGLGWPNFGGGVMTAATTYPDGNQAVGSRVRVSVTYSFPITMPFVPTNAISMSTASQMNIIQ